MMAYTSGQTRPIQAEREKKEFSGKLVNPLSANRWQIPVEFFECV